MVLVVTADSGDVEAAVVVGAVCVQPHFVVGGGVCVQPHLFVVEGAVVGSLTGAVVASTEAVVSLTDVGAAVDVDGSASADADPPGSLAVEVELEVSLSEESGLGDA